MQNSLNPHAVELLTEVAFAYPEPVEIAVESWLLEFSDEKMAQALDRLVELGYVDVDEAARTVSLTDFGGIMAAKKNAKRNAPAARVDRASAWAARPARRAGSRVEWAGRSPKRHQRPAPGGNLHASARVASFFVEFWSSNRQGQHRGSRAKSSLYRTAPSWSPRGQEAITRP